MHQKFASGVQGLRHWLKLAEVALGNHSDRLNAINVFPVPDGDTGTNLYETVRVAAGSAGARDGEDIGEVLGAAANEALEHARGNSGTLFAVFLLGFSEPLVGRERLTARLLAEALNRGQLRSWSALTDPVPGTMLSAMSAASSACGDAVGGEEDPSNAALVAAISAGIEATRQAVLASEVELAPLAAAHVVDAGAVGFLLVLECLKAALCRQELDDRAMDEFHGYRIEDPHVHGQAPQENGFEIMCSMELTALDAASLRAQLDAIGDSIIMSPASTTGDTMPRWRIHVHVHDTKDAMAALECFGATENLRITPLVPADPVGEHPHG